MDTECARCGTSMTWMLIDERWECGLCGHCTGESKADPVPAKPPAFGEWISVGERLPEDYTRVLVGAVNRRGVAISYREHRRWEDVDFEVTHWMEMPQPPGEGI